MRIVFGVLLAVCLSAGACGSDEAGSGGSGGSRGGAGGSPGAQCMYKDPGTTFAPCAKDSDCFGSFCDLTGHPGPYCHVPGSSQVAGLHGITCSADADCSRVLPADAVRRGIVGKCEGRSNLDPAVCQFSCKFAT